MLYRTPVGGGDVEPLGVVQPEAATHRLLSHAGKVYGIQDGAVPVFDHRSAAKSASSSATRGAARLAAPGNRVR